jgi:hypothetical protein
MSFPPNFFDEASAAWLLNKRQIAPGYYVYTCQYIHSNGKHCTNKISNTHKMTCNRHRFMQKTLITQIEHKTQQAAQQTQLAAV